MPRMRYLWLAVVFMASTAVAQVWPHEQEQEQEQAQMTHAARPGLYYPPGSIKRSEEGTAIVKVCVDSAGKLLREPMLTVSSGFADLDYAATRVAKDSRYKPGVRDGAALPESCLEFPVSFRLGSKPADVYSVEPANPDGHDPLEAPRREQQGSPVVQSCVDRKGKLVRDPVIVESSGDPSVDAAAINRQVFEILGGQRRRGPIEGIVHQVQGDV